jgi:hypothetical protein
MKTALSYKTSVNIYQATRYHIPDIMFQALPYFLHSLI